MASPSTRRLLKESTDLHKNPSPYFTASPTSDTNLHDWHFTLVGPPSPSPYARGLYHGRITFPAAYPLRPPSFRFLTPSARFEVNREICLSISGHHEETWQPAWGVRTALLAIRSEIFSGESKGQVGGMEGSEELRREYANLSRGWCCRECGGSNEERMRELWDSCQERGVEIDIDGFEHGNGNGGREGDERDGGEGTAGEDKQDPGVQESSPTSTSTSTSPPAPAAAPQPVTHSPAHSGPSAQTSIPDSIPQPVQASQSPSTSVSTSTPTTNSAIPGASGQLSPHPRFPRPATIASPANSPWLDRAIIFVVVALVILILRRTIDVEDL